MQGRVFASFLIFLFAVITLKNIVEANNEINILKEDLPSKVIDYCVDFYPCKFKQFIAGCSCCRRPKSANRNCYSTHSDCQPFC